MTLATVTRTIALVATLGLSGIAGAQTPTTSLPDLSAVTPAPAPIWRAERLVFGSGVWRLSFVVRAESPAPYDWSSGRPIPATETATAQRELR